MATHAAGEEPMATHDDAMLLVQILRWSEESGANTAMLQILRDHRRGGDPPSADDLDVMKVLVLHETIGTFVKQGLLDADLVDDLLAVDWVWQVLGAGALAQREELGEPRLWENFEALAGH